MDLPKSNYSVALNLLRVSEVSQVLNISRSMVYKLINSGNLQSFRIGRVVRVQSVDLQAFIDQHTFHACPQIDNTIPVYKPINKV